MKSLKIFWSFVILGLLMSCAPFVDVSFDEQINFSDYKTYSFYPDILSGLDSLEQALMVEAVEKVLADKNIIQSESPALYVNFYIDEETSTYENVGADYYNTSNIFQNITLDIVDVDNDRLIWQAAMQSELPLYLDSISLRKYYQATAERLLAKYPPE